MRIVKARINNGQYVDFTYDVVRDKWVALMQVPDTTSYSQPDHKYNIDFEAWDEANNHVNLDRTDSEFGSELAVRVRERVTPLINVTTPAPPTYIITENTINIEFYIMEDGGSGLNLSSVQLTFGSLTFDLSDSEMSYESVTGGIRVNFVLGYTVQDDSYDISIQASDYDENLTINNFAVLVLTDSSLFIYDRTQADVDLVNELHQKYLDGTITEDEKELYATNLKGARNRSDFIRILYNMNYIADNCGRYFDMTGLSIQDLPEIPPRSFVQRIRDKVFEFRNNLPIDSSTPYTPVLPLNTYQKMNDLEKILFDLHESIVNRFIYYCDGGLYADSEIGLLE